MFCFCRLHLELICSAHELGFVQENVLEQDKWLVYADRTDENGGRIQEEWFYPRRAVALRSRVLS